MLSIEKVAYLKGLADGLDLGSETKQDRLIDAIIDVLETVARDIETLDTVSDELTAEIDAVSDDLSAVERIVFDDDTCCCEDDDYADEAYDECCCGHDHEHEHSHSEDECCCGHDHEHEHSHSEGECCCGHEHEHEHSHSEGECCCGQHSGNLYEVVCPACEKALTIDDRILSQGSVLCPNCGATLEFDLEEDEPQEAPTKDEQ